MEKYLDQGKILDVHLKMLDGSNHGINIYGYHQDKNDSDIVWFDVYDSNLPNCSVSGMSISETGITIKTTRRLNQNGSGYSFDYEYFPVTNKKYGATSNKTITKNPYFIVMDENWLPINN